jgi:N utilization substance protein B
MAEKKFNRRVIREKCLQILYAFDMNGEGLTSITDSIFADIPNKIDKEFGERLVNKVIGNIDEIDAKIKERVNNWEMDRIALIDKLLLRMGIAELIYFDDIPPKVSINEVIEIAKNFSTSNSGKFINGILDAVLNDLKKCGRITKTGRGLIDESLPKKA